MGDQDDAWIEVAPPPEQSDLSKGIEDIASSVAGVVPFVGPAFQRVIERGMQEEHERRMGEWLRTVAAAIEQLQGRVEAPEELLQKPEFFDALAEATQIAQRRGDDEWRDLLRCAVINTAIRANPSEDERRMFMRFLGDFTLTHIRTLEFLDGPRAFYDRRGLRWPSEMTMGGLPHFVPPGQGISFNDGLGGAVLADLDRSGLVSHTNFSTMMTIQGIEAQKTTPFGRRFIEFVTEAPEA